MKTVCLFPGQSSEHPGMFAGLEGRKQFQRIAVRILQTTGHDISSQDALIDPLTAQLAVFGASACYWQMLPGNVQVAALAGHSLGFYSALFAAGVLSFDECLRIIVAVHEAIERSSQGIEGRMATVIGLSEESVAGICARSGHVFVAGVNAATQIVISGKRQAVADVCSSALDAGALGARELPIPYALHSPLMRDIDEHLAGLSASLEIRTPAIPVMSHVDASVLDRDGIARVIRGQLGQKMRWRDTVVALAGSGASRFIEIGPGDVLARLTRWIVRDAETMTAEEMLNCQVA